MTQTLTCSAHSGLQAGVATRARRMRLEAPASPLALSRKRERERPCCSLSRLRERAGVRAVRGNNP